MAKHVRIRYSGDIIAWILRDGHKLKPTFVQNGLPSGARFVRCFEEDGVVSLVFEHESFPESSSKEIPILCPLFTDLFGEVWEGYERRSGSDRRLMVKKHG